ncbi:hypothetical protein J7E45_01355 [Microbacterium sp. ISL-59]|uniref:hypothetical protein n=1 Tax=Microbacterium sp. ISL-59 TaxID=2819159 RepID=UPI001BE5568B|nr:hypothetical protein [Microbacterium sp. ISL-59]MBT2494242.1 hypothetical protein [Microbacterium sp. ISL-59]
MFELGESVTTPDGANGRITAPQDGGRFHYYTLGSGEQNISVYEVLVDGRVERWTEAALIEAGEMIKVGGH